MHSGCKACEVACLEWNGYNVQRNHIRQQLPDNAGNGLELLELIKFNEHEREDGSMMPLMRKDQCMHCEDPGCLAACPADSAIVQYANGIVDFQEAHCIGCGYCVTGCPFNIPNRLEAHKVFQRTLCNDRVSQGLETRCIKTCPTAAAFRNKIRNEVTGRNACIAASQPVGLSRRRRLRSSRSRRNATATDVPRRQESGIVRRPAEDLDIPWFVRLWKGPLKWLGNLAMIGGLVGLAVHHAIRPKEEVPIAPGRSEAQ